MYIQGQFSWQGPVKSEQRCVPGSLYQIENLSLSYGSKLAFENISVNIHKESITGIIGPSGCGKSSFIHCLNRMSDIIPTAQVKGQIYLEGNQIFDKSVNLKDLRKKVGLIFQDPTPLPLSIKANLDIALKEHGFDKREQRIQNALNDVGLWNEVKDILDRPATNLSGGQKQRLCIARTIALEPEIILLDEPCSSLDPLSTEHIEKLLVKLKSRYSIVIVTHNLSQARRICDHILAFWYNENNSAGTLLEAGTCSEIFSQSSNKVLSDYVRGNRG